MSLLYLLQYTFRCQSIQNLGLAVISIITGLIIDHLGYAALSEFFLGSLLCKYYH